MPAYTFLTDALLQTAVAGEAPDLVVDDVKTGLVVLRRELLGGHRETDRVCNSLTLSSQRCVSGCEAMIESEEKLTHEGSRRNFDAGFLLNLGMTGRL